VVHRDVKPGNVWLTEDGGQRTEARESSLSPGERVRPALSRAEGVRGTAAESIQTAKLGDFGLAVAMDRSRLTQAGMMVGTVSYMPPEQAVGGEVTLRSDLYSLGAMLYEMVCG